VFDDRLRHAKDRALAPIATRLRAVPPLAITAAGLVAGLGCAGAAYYGHVPLALGLWAANRTLDGLDGSVARQAGTTSDRGGYIDLLADFVVYAAIPVAQVAGAPDPGELAVPVGALLGAYYVNAVSWLALSAILTTRVAAHRPMPDEIRERPHARTAMLTTITMPTGLVEGAETVIFVAVCLAWPDALRPLFFGGAALVLATALLRAVWAWRTLGRA
jgi:phosphatidylserine synthase